MKKNVEFSISLLFFWVKGKIAVDYRFIKISTRNTLLSFIPAGEKKQTIPLKNVSSADISSRYNIKPLIIGVIIILVSRSLGEVNLLTRILIFILGIGVTGSGIETSLTVQKSGDNYVLSVPFYDKNQLYIIEKSINKALARDIDKTDLSLNRKRKKKRKPVH